MSQRFNAVSEIGKGLNKPLFQLIKCSHSVSR